MRGGREGRKREARAAGGRRHGLADAGAGSRRESSRGELAPGRADVEALGAARVAGPVGASLPSPRARRAARAWLAGKQGSGAVGRPPPNLEGENAASGSGGSGRGGALSAPRGRPRKLLPGLRTDERAEAERAGSGSGAGTAPALRARAASATVPALPPHPGAMVRGARASRAGL